MKKIATIIAWMLFSLPSYAQLEIDYNYLRQQQNEIANTIRPELEAQARQNMQKTQQNQPQANQSQMQLGQRQTQVQVNQQQAIENFNSRISNEGEQRMEYYNNPDNYIDRSITNRKSSLNNTNSQVNSPNRYNSPNQYNDLRTRPIHSEELTSKSLQMLREANREYFSNEDREEIINPNAQVPLFDAPNLGVPLWQELEEKMDMEEVYAELSPEQKAAYDKTKKEIIERIKNLEYEAETAKFDAKIDRALEESDGATWYDNLRWYGCKEKIAQEEEKLRQLDELARKAVRNKRNK